jgi:mRNA-degrading endonuclease RelE of RelBE toxin-antitoxin system
MTTEVILTPHFEKQVKSLKKKYPNVNKDLEPLIDDLEGGGLPGDRLQRLVSHEAYKVRLPNRDTQRGKSGGYRVIYYVRTADTIYLLEIYAKSDVENISDADIIAQIMEAIDQNRDDNSSSSE